MRIAESKVDIKPLDITYFHFISIILQAFRGWNPKYRGGNVKGVG